MIICNCYNVTESEVNDAISGGCLTLEDIKTHTRAATGCGVCEFYIFKILNNNMTSNDK